MCEKWREMVCLATGSGSKIEEMVFYVTGSGSRVWEMSGNGILSDRKCVLSMGNGQKWCFT
jgi:hypothetical protein